MPRTKRPLAEADPNAARAAPKAKHSKTSDAKESINPSASDDYTSKTNDELVALLRERGLAHTGIKRTLVERLIEADTEEDTMQARGHAALSSKQEYWSKSKNELIDMLRKQGLAHTGPKEALVKRLEAQLEQPKKPVKRLKQDISTKGTINYHTKDNGKLAIMLKDRDLPTYDTREEMIACLERNPANYEQFTAEALIKMLKGRHLINADSGNKDTKIARLKLNDEMDRDPARGCHYGYLMAYSDIANNRRPLPPPKSNNKYSTYGVGRVDKLLKERKLSRAGSLAIKIERLRDYDTAELRKVREAHVRKYTELITEWEAEAGHPIDMEEVNRQEEYYSRRDREILDQVVTKKAAFPTCQYNWKDSHWASRTERELRDICQRRGMDGNGTKATYLKWLDTGSVDYEDLSVGSLQSMYKNRGIRAKYSEKKVDLIMKLREADAETATE
ncbi:hypothetical protein B0J14DRAFT_96633 [Halenospora varia]|nr:hypothetical protein B0J14DRAFT_96633 [Halenospora varia]